MACSLVFVEVDLLVFVSAAVSFVTEVAFYGRECSQSRRSIAFRGGSGENLSLRQEERRPPEGMTSRVRTEGRANECVRM